MSVLSEYDEETRRHIIELGIVVYEKSKNFNIAKMNMNEENGCTLVVPGSHQSGIYTDRSLKEKKLMIHSLFLVIQSHNTIAGSSFVFFISIFLCKIIFSFK